MVTVNLACLLALQGRRVGMVDVNLQSPGLSLTWGLKPSQITYTFNDYLRERCGPKAIAYDVRRFLGKKIPVLSERL
jgi:MinD-like ATPase involved in chromosome partitioning or flagellar assembly